MLMLTAIFLLRLSGVQCGGSVTYPSTGVCGLKGASVVLPCKYEYSWVGYYKGGEWYKEKRGRVREHSNSDYPDCSLKIDKLSDDHSGVYYFRFYTFLHPSWITGLKSQVTVSITHLQVKEGAVVGKQNQTELTCSTSCSLSSNTQYVWYKNGQPLQDKTTASILLDSSRPSDEGNYSCVVRGYEAHHSPAVCAPSKQCWGVTYCVLNGSSVDISGSPGVNISVTVLQVLITPEAVKEGEKVTLTCNATCILSNNPTFIWYKNGEPVTLKHTTRDRLHLNPVSSDDVGSYSCAVRRQESLFSTDVFLKVRYKPKNVSVSISPGEIVEGSSVTLTCSSDANPPVHNYTWYMKTGAESRIRGTGDSISFNVTSDSSGLYYCEAENEVGSQTSTGVAVPTAAVAGIILVAIITIIIILAVLLLFGIVYMSKHEGAESNSRKNQRAVHSDAHDETYTALNPRSTSSEYDNLQNVRNVSDTYIPFQRRAQASVYEVELKDLGMRCQHQP